MSNKLSNKRCLNFEEIKSIIPQRFPFLMLDRVTDLNPGESVIGWKNLTGNEWFFQGHFPKRAITPGAMICEAIAQTGIVFFHATRGTSEDVTYLLGGIKIRFLNPVWPGDQLQIRISPVKLTSSSAILNAEVYVEDKKVSKGEFTLSVKDNALI